MNTPQSPFAALQALQEEQREGYSQETIAPTAMNTTDQTFHTPNVVQQRREWAAAVNAAMNPAPAILRPLTAEEKNATGLSDESLSGALTTGPLDDSPQANELRRAFKDAPAITETTMEALRQAGVEAPAGKLTDEQRGEIGSKVASEMILSHSNKLCQSAFLFVTNGGMYEYGYNEHAPARTAFARAVREAVEKEQAEEIAQLTAIIEQSIEMVNTPGTTKGNLPKAINAKIMQRDEFHDATLKKLDAAKEDVKRLLKLDATNRENCDRTHKALVESQLLQLETQKALTAVTADLDRMQLEFKKQAEKKAFEEWWDSCDQFDNSKPAAWFVWQARAAKEGEK